MEQTDAAHTVCPYPIAPQHAPPSKATAHDLYSQRYPLYVSSYASAVQAFRMGPSVGTGGDPCAVLDAHGHACGKRSDVRSRHMARGFARGSSLFSRKLAIRCHYEYCRFSSGAQRIRRNTHLKHSDPGASTQFRVCHAMLLRYFMLLRFTYRYKL